KMSADGYANRMRSLDDYFTTLDRLLQEQNWDRAEIAGKLLSVHGPHSSHAFLQVDRLGSQRNRPFLRFDDTFDAIAVLHLQVLHDIYIERNYEAAYDVHTQIMKKFTEEVLRKWKDCNWFLPLFYQLCTDLRNTAKMADELGVQDEDRDSSYYEQCASFIMESYRACITDTYACFHAVRDLSISKKIAILNMTNQLFRIYFKINKLNLLKPLIRTIDNSENLKRGFSMADKVTYNYFLGRNAMFDSNLPLAEKSLSYAFRNCPPECSRNKRLVLVYLIPVKMFLGHMPNSSVLHKYKLDEFIEVVEAVKVGNLAQLDAALTKHEDFFIQCGIFLMLEKLRTITFRNLFKRISLILGKNQIPLDAFLVCLKFLGVNDVDADELACIVANLIAQNKIKGYISHAHQKLVISKMKPFPDLHA
ncbi:hypothetical protein PFISCL1PPCAC_23510, partial [Pristionchus fissidentatus]